MKKTSLLFAAMLLFVACNTNNSENIEEKTTLSGSVQIDGSSTVYPITEAIAEEFQAIAPDVKVTVGLSGTGGGFKKFCRGEIDINDASRPIKDSEITLCNETKITYTDFMVAYDGMAILVNPANDWVDTITVEELKKIWEPEAQNVITKWNQIRPEWPNEKINLYGAGTASGTFDYFTEAIMGESGKSRGDFTASEDDNVLVQGIANDKYSLGFFGLAYYEENMDKLKLLAVDNGTAAVYPSIETVKDGTYSPLSRPLFIYVNNQALKKTEIMDFLKFYLKNAGTLAAEVGYVPLSETEYATKTAKLNAL